MQDVKELLCGREKEEAFAFLVEDRYITIQETFGGYYYSIKDMSYNEIDGGIYDDPSVSIVDALEAVLSDILAMPAYRLEKGNIKESSILKEIAYDEFFEMADPGF